MYVYPDLSLLLQSETLERTLKEIPENFKKHSHHTSSSISGIHREFTHRVKSVSMAKFTPEEVTALQTGGNERAKQIYFKEWDPLRHSYPDSCNMSRLRDFIKRVYVERRYSGPNSSPGPRNDETGFRYLYDESRSPKYTQKYSRHGGQARSPIKFEVVDDRLKDDECRNRRLSNIESKLKKISIDGNKSVDKSPLPIARPLGYILKENTPSLQVTHSGGKGSVEENRSEQKINNPESIIDLSSKSQDSPAAVEVGQEAPQTTQSNESNWAIFEASTENNNPKPPNTDTVKPTTEAAPEAATPAKNPIDLLLFELSGPVTPVTGGMPQSQSGLNNDPTTTTVENASLLDFLPISTGQTVATPNNASVWSFPPTPTTELAQPSNEVPPQNQVSHAHQQSSMQYLPSVSAGFISTTQPIDSPLKDVASNNQVSNITNKTFQCLEEADENIVLPSVAPTTNDSSSAFELSSQTTSKPTQETIPDIGSQLSKVETRSSGRQALPEDLFTSNFSSGLAPSASWQNVQQQGIGYGMQYYHNVVPPSALPSIPMASNPFELTDGRSLIHASSLPCMESLHGVPPAVSPRTGLIHASSVGSLVSQSPCYASPISMGVYIDQIIKEEQSTGPQRTQSFNSMTAFESLDPIQQPNRAYTTPKTAHCLPNTSGNPCG
ncbi:hypothetical protein Fmac_032185 [Flemingia macrophylla]|uniref:Arf-GAP domain-containing protein n=1 Tax=Flemingia macrophylla TaxID=520843 RepID=A0ABD1L476_9FABA